MNPELVAHIFDIQKLSVIDGPGIRTTVFFKGCNLRCAWCHNPESQSAKRELIFYRQRCTDCGMCKRVCKSTRADCTLCGRCAHYCQSRAKELVGREIGIAELMEQIEGDRPFYESSGGGVTFSGGECMLQAEALSSVLQACKERGIHTAVDTAGDVPFERFERILPYTDLFLYDVKCFDRERHRQYTGVRNERILDNLRTLSEKTEIPIIVRIPVIPGFNTDREELVRMAQLLRPLRLRAVELLPYHRMGEQKYAALGREATFFSVPTEEEMETYRSYFAPLARA